MKTKVFAGRIYYSVDGWTWYPNELQAIQAAKPQDPPRDKVSEAAALLGARGGRAKGSRKARPGKHYQDMLKKRWGK